MPVSFHQAVVTTGQGSAYEATAQSLATGWDRQTGVCLLLLRTLGSLPCSDTRFLAL